MGQIEVLWGRHWEIGEHVRNTMILEHIRDFKKNLCSQCVPIMIPKHFQVPKYVPQDVPNSTWVLSLMVCTKFNSPVYKLKSRGACYFYFASGGPKRCFYWGHARFSQKIADGPINMAT